VANKGKASATPHNPKTKQPDTRGGSGVAKTKKMAEKSAFERTWDLGTAIQGGFTLKDAVLEKGAN